MVANIKSRVVALERRAPQEPEAPWQRVVQPTGLTAAERQEWRAALASQPGRFIIRTIYPWPPATVAEVAELIEMGRTPDELLEQMQSVGSNSGVAAVRAYQHRNGLA